MDKYEYQVCTEQIKQLIAEKRFVEAMEIADTIDWRRVRSVSMLVTVSEIYKVNRRYEDARDILLLAYERHPSGRDIIYALCELAIKLNDIVQAIECYKEFCNIAPGDADSCVLLYKIYKAQDVSLEEQIDVLEECKSKEYKEKWAYELAYLYHKTGQEAKCIAECDELILWFGEGKYVRKAMELKMQHTALTADQQAKYDGRAVTSNMPVFEQPVRNDNQFGNNAQMTGPMMNQYGEYIQQTGPISDFYATGQLQQPGYATGQINTMFQTGQMNDMYQTGQMSNMYNMNQGYSYDQPVQVTPDQYTNGAQPIQVTTPGMNHLGMTQNIMVQSMGTGVWNTVDLQEKLGSQVREVMGDYGSYNNYSDNYNYGQQDMAPVYGDSTGNILPVEETPLEQATEENNITVEPVKEQADFKVNTGIIDLSGTELQNAVSPEKETSDIMSQLQGVIPGTKAPVNEAPDNNDTTNYPKTKHSITGAIPDVLPSIKDTSEFPEEITAITDEETVEEEKIEESNEVVTESVEESTEDVIAEVPEEPVIETVEKKAVEEDIPYISAVNVEKMVEDEEAESEPEEEELSEQKEEVLVSNKRGNYPYDTVVDIGYVEELPEIEQPEDVEDILKTGKLPIDSIASAYETDAIPEAEEYEVDEVDDEDSLMPSFMRDNVRAHREFDDDEYRVFCRYDGMEGIKAQLVEALDLMSMESSHGNIVIMGPETADCKGLAINLVKAMQSKNQNFSGKVAKISGEALNKKDIKGTLKKLENGALIVEGAGGLTKESVLIITGVLSEEPENVIVILEGLKEQIKPLFKVTKLMKTVFDARIDVGEYTDDDLVNYGRGYALEKEYFIDEMGGLALHNRISEMQTYDHKVTIDEVKELVDEAIRHVDKKNMGHFMDMLLGRRYDDEDNIILSEKDFIF